MNFLDVATEEAYFVLQFSGRALEITLWDYDKVGSSEFIGEVRSSVTIQKVTEHCPKAVAYSKLRSGNERKEMLNHIRKKRLGLKPNSAENKFET